MGRRLECHLLYDMVIAILFELNKNTTDRKRNTCNFSFTAKELTIKDSKGMVRMAIPSDKLYKYNGGQVEFEMNSIDLYVDLANRTIPEKGTNYLHFYIDDKDEVLHYELDNE